MREDLALQGKLLILGQAAEQVPDYGFIADAGGHSKPLYHLMRMPAFHFSFPSTCPSMQARPHSSSAARRRKTRIRSALRGIPSMAASRLRTAIRPLSVV